MRFANVRRSLTLFSAALAMCFVQSGSLAQDLASAIPASANAAARIDVKGLISSPLGGKEGWQSKLMGGYSTRPLAVPAFADRVAMAALLELPDLNPMWQISVIDVSNKVDLSRVSAEQKGVLDTVAGKTAVTTQFNVMHVAMSDKRIGTLWPAQRQLAAHLLAKDGIARGGTEYLAAALKTDPANQVVAALDLHEAFSGASVRKAMAMGGLASLDKVEEIAKVSDALAGVRGVTAKVKVDNAIHLDLAADFAGPVPLPPAAVKPFCMELLADAGLPADLFQGLNYEVSGNQIVASGEVTAPAIAAIIGLLVPDATHSSLATAVTPSAATGVPPAPENPQAAASQEYYRTIAAILDKLTSSTSMSATATQLRGHARQIQQLPVLNVDPDILAWSANVVELLNQAAAILAVGQQNAQNAAMGIASPTAEATYTETGYGGQDTAAGRAAFRNAQQQRRQAAQTERVRAASDAFKLLTDSSRERAELRAKMTQKYGVEF